MTTLRIALRYLFSTKSHSAVNVISIVSMAGVALATAALIIVLSVFNGFRLMLENNSSKLSPDLKIELTQGHFINNADSLTQTIQSHHNVKLARPIIEAKALAVLADEQTPVRIKGVDIEAYTEMSQIKSAIIDGDPWQTIIPDVRPAIISVGVANALLSSPSAALSPMAIYIPRRLGHINPANPITAFRNDSVSISAIFAVNQPEYDSDLVIIDIEQARTLYQCPDQATAIEITTIPGADIQKIKQEITASIGPKYTILTSEEQNAASLRIVNMEKWMSFLLLAFILVIAAFNIVSTMALLIIEKEPNAQILHAIGATKRQIRSIYSIQGWLITLVGGIIGITFGTLLSLGQQHFGWIKLSDGSANTIIDTYPVELIPTDILPVAAIIAAIGAVTALFASRYSR